MKLARLPRPVSAGRRDMRIKGILKLVWRSTNREDTPIEIEFEAWERASDEDLVRFELGPPPYIDDKGRQFWRR